MPLKLTWLLPLALVVSACTVGATSSDSVEPSRDRDVASEPGGDIDDTSADAESTGAADPHACRVDGLPGASQEPVVQLTGDDPADVARAAAATTHRCAPSAVVAAASDWDALLAAVVARSAEVPLLLADRGDPSPVVAALDQLDTEEVVTVGVGLASLGRPGHELSERALSVRDLEGAPPSTEVDAADPDATDPDATDPDATDPDATDPDATDPDATDPDATDPDAEAAGPDPTATFDLALEVAAHLDTDEFVAVAIDDVQTAVAVVARLGGSATLLPLPRDAQAIAALAERLPHDARVRVPAASGTDDLADALERAGVATQPEEGELWPSTAATAWLVDPAQAAVAAVAAVTTATRDEALLPIVADDLRAGEDARRVREASPERVVLVGEVTDDAAWQLETVLTGATLPSGGHRLFENERMVALYGHPGSAVLGALGEQELDQTVERVREVAAPYDADGADVLPTFEIITTIASAEPGARGDYSRRSDPELLRPWIERAAAEGFYVVLDLQPGRTDFLEQAQEYEEFLREPHVGLALDPEWRLEPDQVHLQQIGSVEVAEVQRVADWLADLTREHRLPQKALVLHQFRLAMLPDRDLLVAPPELAVVVHMDGQGAIEDKYATYELITADAEDRWVWGWKNFYDEDLPTPTPAQVLELEPLPWFVSYQ
jgi:hypothetical protein